MAELKKAFKIVVYAGAEDVFAARRAQLVRLGMEPEHVLWCDSGRRSRMAMLNRHPGEWLCFLDHDCRPDTELLSELARRAADTSGGKKAFAGRYRNPEGAGYLQRTHNFIANTWLEESYQPGKKPLLLGGIFMAFNPGTALPEPATLFWGAEDKQLAHELERAGFVLRLAENLLVEHGTAASWRHFFRRARLHGSNDARYLTDRGDRVSYPFWIRKVGFANLSLLPLVVLHFCIQRAARSAQIILRTNRSDTSDRTPARPD